MQRSPDGTRPDATVSAEDVLPTDGGGASPTAERVEVHTVGGRPARVGVWRWERDGSTLRTAAVYDDEVWFSRTVDADAASPREAIDGTIREYEDRTLGDQLAARIDGMLAPSYDGSLGRD